MKFIVVFVIFAALFAVVLGVRPTPPRKCDFKCTKLDDTTCGANAKCLHRFPSKCQMERYNCLFPKKAFTKMEDWKCVEKSMPLCAFGDL